MLRQAVRPMGALGAQAARSGGGAAVRGARDYGSDLNQPDQGPPKEGSLRPALGKELMGNVFGANWFATGVFKAMNFAMYAEGQPLPKEHADVLHDSLVVNKKGVLDTLIAENPHVMQSTGNTPIYLLGKYMVHTPLEKYLEITNKKLD